MCKETLLDLGDVTTRPSSMTIVRTSIGFTLVEPAPVSVHVYNLVLRHYLPLAPLVERCDGPLRRNFCVLGKESAISYTPLVLYVH